MYFYSSLKNVHTSILRHNTHLVKMTEKKLPFLLMYIGDVKAVRILDKNMLMCMHKILYAAFLMHNYSSCKIFSSQVACLALN